MYIHVCMCTSYFINDEAKVLAAVPTRLNIDDTETVVLLPDGGGDFKALAPSASTGNADVRDEFTCYAIRNAYANSIVCTYMCLYIYIYACIYIYICVCIYICIYIYMYVSIDIYIYINV